MPKVSVVVPVYNVEKYLDRTMQSLLCQTLKDIEIILVNDGSPDNCPALCDGYTNKYPNVKVIHKRNEGLGMARNSGLDVAIGEYVMFVDGDDAIEHDSCERLYGTAIKYNADIVCGNFNTEIRPGVWENTQQPEGLQILRGENVYQYLLDMIATAPHTKVERLYPVSVCITCIRRALIEDIGLRFKSEREIPSEDTIFKSILLKHAQILVQLPYAFYFYYINKNSLTHSFDINKFYKLKAMYLLLKEIFKNDNEAEQRINRFIISDARIHFLRLIKSSQKHKIKLIKQMMADEIWNYVHTYKPSYFPIYQRIFYLLIIKEKPAMLYAYAWLIVTLKELLRK